jgi:hypothetical protein
MNKNQNKIINNVLLNPENFHPKSSINKKNLNMIQVSMFIDKFISSVKNGSSLYKFRNLKKDHFEFMDDKSCKWTYFVNKINFIFNFYDFFFFSFFHRKNSECFPIIKQEIAI